MRQVGFWKGFVSAFVVMIGLYAVNVSARQGGVYNIDNTKLMADALVVCAEELREMNDKGIRVKVESDKPLKLDRLEIRMPDGVEVKPSSRPLEVKTVTALP